MSRNRIRRVLQILVVLQSGQNCKIANFVTTLNASRRTIYRDLKELRLAGISFSYDRTDGCYKLDPDFHLLVPSLNAAEVLGLLLLVYKAREHIKIPFSNTVLTAALKIEGSLPSDVRTYCNRRLQYISIKKYPQTGTELFDKIFSDLLEAITKKRVLDIRYYLAGKKESALTTLYPYHLLYDRYSWYVLGWSGLHKRICPLKMNRIKEVTQTGKCFIENKRFDVNDYLGRAWSMRREGVLYNVKLWFAPDISDSITEAQWHSTQKVDFQEDGSLIIEFRVDGLNEITWWILSYGEKVRVLAPEVLRKKIAEIAKKTQRANDPKST